MKRFGLHKAIDEAVAANEVASIHIKIKKFSELADITNQRVAIFIGNDGEYRTGDVIIKGDDGIWSKVGTGGEPIGPVTRLRCRRVGSRVIIRWKDPDDSFDANMNCIAKWSKTVLVRKYGSAPVSIMDGTHVYVNEERNQFNKNDEKFYADCVPVADESIDLYYRAFAISEYGYIDNTSTAVKTAAMPWEDIVEHIKNGYGSGIMDAGDVLRLTSEDGSKTVELLCLGNDCTKSSRTLTSPHTMVFGFRYLFPGSKKVGDTWVADGLNYDDPSSYIKPTNDDGYAYKRTRDRYAATGKTYYLARMSGTTITDFRRVGLSIGASLSGGVYYERIPEARAVNGNYRWNTSDVRATLNAAASVEGSPMNILTSIDPEFASIITDTVVACRKHSLDGGGAESSNDKFFLPSITEIFGIPNGGERAYEGTQFTFFEDNTPEMFVDVPNGSLIRSGWVTRSANLDDAIGSTIYGVNENGVQISKDASYIGPMFVVFSIG